MCRAIYDMVEDGRQEGRLEGERRAIRFIKLRAEEKTNYEIAEECAVSVEEVETFFGLLL